MIKNKNIFIVSNETWGETWYSKHNYAWELSQNNKVYFINPPVPFSFSNIFKKNIVETKIKDSLSILTYKNKSAKWDKIGEKIAKCYVDENGDELSEEESEEIDLGTIGEIAASAFGWL